MDAACIISSNKLAKPKSYKSTAFLSDKGQTSTNTLCIL
jgi:hypothetical protein